MTCTIEGKNSVESLCEVTLEATVEEGNPIVGSRMLWLQDATLILASSTSNTNYLSKAVTFYRRWSFLWRANK